MFLPLLAHRLWRLTLQIWHGTPYLSRRPISNESAKDVKKPLVTGSKDLSITQGLREDQASGPSETKPIISTSSTQLVCVVTDLDRLQEQQVVKGPLACKVPEAGLGQPARLRVVESQ
ncbi:COG2, partial [Cervus elaphus hippelaphus]